MYNEELRGQLFFSYDIDEDEIPIFTWQTNNANLTLNQWPHVVCSYDGDSFRVYLDGSEILSKPGSIDHPAIFDSTAPVIIGGHKSMYWLDFFNGRIDDVRIYNRTLSMPEVLYLNTLTPDTGDGDTGSGDTGFFYFSLISFIVVFFK